MKLTFSQVVPFVQKPPAAVRVVLVYGPDAGLAQERAETLAKGIVKDLNDPFRVSRFSASAIGDDPARLYDEMAAMALGGGRRLVWVQQASESFATALGALLKDMPQTDAFLLIQAGELEKKRSKLIALCDAEGSLTAAVPCYVEDGAARQKTIIGILGAEGLDVPRDIAMHLVDKLPPDQMALRSELEKLALYMGPDEKTRRGKTLTLEDVHACLEDTGAAEMDDLVMSVASGAPARVAVLLTHLWAEQTSPVAVLRAAQRHFVRLRLARAHIDQGMGAESALKKLQPPVFWKNEKAMAAQAQRWSAARLDKMLERLTDAEAACKRTGTPDVALCSQLMMMAARG